MVVERTERGDEMFLTLFRRVCQQILDLGSLELLPEPGATPVARQPEAHDEGAHDPGTRTWYRPQTPWSRPIGTWSGAALTNPDWTMTTSVVRMGGDPEGKIGTSDPRRFRHLPGCSG